VELEYRRSLGLLLCMHTDKNQPPQLPAPPATAPIRELQRHRQAPEHPQAVATL